MESLKDFLVYGRDIESFSDLLKIAKVYRSMKLNRELLFRELALVVLEKIKPLLKRRAYCIFTRSGFSGLLAIHMASILNAEGYNIELVYNELYSNKLFYNALKRFSFTFSIYRSSKSYKQLKQDSIAVLGRSIIIKEDYKELRVNLDNIIKESNISKRLYTRAMLFTSKIDVKDVVRPLEADANKYSHGKICVIALSDNMEGASKLSAYASEYALSALRSGSGYVTIASNYKIQSLNPTVINYIIKEPEAIEDIIESKKADIFIIGNGTSYPNEAIDSILDILYKRNDLYIILDAAAIGYIRKTKHNNVIVTPHLGELKRYLNIDLEESSLYDKAKTAIELSKRYGSIFVIKGRYTVISDGRSLRLSEAETPALATMGTGDVLNGIIASFLARDRKDPFKATVAAVELHKEIGDMLFKYKGTNIIATDIIDYLPTILKRYIKADRNGAGLYRSL
ncbi:MAG: ADP-dependent (S)-NAD(P)H-hydrate dehydratase [Candidatus Micrarchaeota archaeon]|nr:MAG: ADP-dependent (S)-NAD(P)H-hydrate dehydratase [Candidatus Micrarchaeota archaeon]